MLSPGLAQPPPGTGDGLRDRDMSELGVPATRDKAPGHLSARFGETDDGKVAQRSAAQRGVRAVGHHQHRTGRGHCTGPALGATGEADPPTSCRHPEGTQVSGSRRTRTWNRRERRHSGLNAQVLLLRRPLAVVQSEVGGGGGSSAVMGSCRPVAARRRRRRGAVWSEGSQLDCRWENDQGGTCEPPLSVNRDGLLGEVGRRVRRRGSSAGPGAGSWELGTAGRLQHGTQAISWAVATAMGKMGGKLRDAWTRGADEREAGPERTAKVAAPFSPFPCPSHRGGGEVDAGQVPKRLS